MDKASVYIVLRQRLCNKVLSAIKVLVFLQLLVLTSSSIVIGQENKVAEKDSLAPWQVLMNDKKPPFKHYFKGVLILDGKVMRNGAYTLDTISKNSIRSISVIKNIPHDYILKYGDAAREGIMILKRN